MGLFLLSFLVNVSISFYFIAGQSLAAYASMRDGAYFLALARSGYSSENPVLYGFFPGYPLLIRLLSPVLCYEWSAILSSIFCASASAVVFYRIAKLYSGHSLWLSILFIFIPYAWFAVSSMPQSDSLFMFLSLLTFYYAKTGKFPRAFISCAVASATRLTSVIFLPFLLYECLRQGKGNYIFLLPLVFAPIGFLFLYFGWTAGNVFLYFEIGRGWAEAGRYFTYPGQAFLAFGEVSQGVALKIVLIVVVYALALWRLRRNLDLLIWSAPLFAAHLSLSPHPFFYFGLDRFLTPFFPVFFAYEDVLCCKQRASQIISLTLTALSIAETYRTLLFFLRT